jgi:hypothetical protein
MPSGEGKKTVIPRKTEKSPSQLGIVQQPAK